MLGQSAWKCDISEYHLQTSSGGDYTTIQNKTKQKSTPTDSRRALILIWVYTTVYLFFVIESRYKRVDEFYKGSGHNREICIVNLLSMYRGANFGPESIAALETDL